MKNKFIRRILPMTMAVIVAVSPLSTVKAMENVSDNTLLEEEEDTEEKEQYLVTDCY